MPRTRQLPVNVAAFGDSLMWGQGLRRQGRFTELIARALPALFERRQPDIVWDESRSGAKIRARGDDRPTFADQFPTYFRPGELPRFLESKTDLPGTRLYGEIPATFPTVRGQVDLMPLPLGRTVDVALVDGGINDIEVESIVNPQEFPGEFIEQWDGFIRSVAYDDVLDLLGRVRRKCPKAVILYFGIFAMASLQSDTQEIRALLKHEHDDDFGWWLNDVFDFVDVNAVIHEAIVRSGWMQGRFQYWSRQAVAEANRSAPARGPGVLFVPSGFLGANSLFAETPFFHQDYTDPTTDPARTERRRQCPRAGQLNRMRSAHAFARSSSRPRGVRQLNDAINGPLSLKRALQDYLDLQSRRRTQQEELSAIERLREPLKTEIKRIQRALIASFSHPNAAGARSYAVNAVTRLRRHLQLREELERPVRPGAPQPALGGETLEQTITRYGLRTVGPLLADIGHLDVDSLALRVVTAADSDQNFFPNIWLYVTTNANYGRPGSREYLVNLPYRRSGFGSRSARAGTPPSWFHKYYPQFEPGETNRFTIDTAGRLRLDEIVGCHLVVGNDPLARRPPSRTRYGMVWRPTTVALEVNGREVVSLDLAGRSFTFGDTLDLTYPASQSDFRPPRTLPTVTIARVRPVARRPASSPRPDQEPLVST